jgi:hypothetical protein
MQVPREMVLQKLRSEDPEAATKAEGELPEKVDTEADADLLQRLGIDPSTLGNDLGDQAPSVG